METAYGDKGGFPAMLLEMILAQQPVAVLPNRASLCAMIHEDDIFAQLSGLLAAASQPATIVNWGGDEPVAIPDLCHYIGQRIDRQVELVESEDGIHQYWQDPSKRIALAGKGEVDWRTGVDRMIAARHPELPLG